jgi:flagellar assembly protein FliH
MMSLSDIENTKSRNSSSNAGSVSSAGEEFKPLDLNALDSFEEEQSQNTDGVEPDFERFKLLFDPSELEEEEVTFEDLYAFDKEIKDEPFEPLIEGTGIEGGTEPVDAREPVDGEPEQEVIPEISPEQRGYELGYEKGLTQGQADGLAKGEAKGFEQGFAKGEAQGVEKGKADGFAQGEEQGFEKGLKEGSQSAEAKVREEAGQILDPLKESLETADKLLDTLLMRYENQIVELVYKIAEKAVMAKLDVDDEVVKNTVMDALQSLVAPEEISLSISTEDYEYVEMIKDEFFESVRSLKSVAVTSDPMIPKGGCRIESAAATISTDPESKLTAVYDSIARAKRS